MAVSQRRFPLRPIKVAGVASPGATGVSNPLGIARRGGLDHTKAGEAFNLQPDGSAALWTRFDRTLADGEAAVDFGGTLLPGNRSGNVMTAAVPASLYAKPGVFMVYVVARKDTQSVRSNDVRFIVE